ncbi:MAG: restriction endonuclease subunit R [Hormoscilla sp.]
MVEIIPAQKLNIIDVESKFGLTETEDDEFFPEWKENLPDITELEKQALDRVKLNYLSLVKRREISENMVKMTVLGPLLVWTDFYQLPFDILDEQAVELAVADEDEIVRGRLDIVVLQDHLWLLTIESKNAGLSLLNGIPQALFYMIANPNPTPTVYGLVTNGNNFLFIKLSKQDNPQYALSDEFTLSHRRENGLYTVLKILKKIGQLVS